MSHLNLLHVRTSYRASPSPSASSPAHRLEIALVSQSECVKAVDAHHLNVARVSCEIETDYNNQIGQHQDASFEIVALALAIHIAEQENAEDDGHHVPLRKNEIECVIQKLIRIDVGAMDGAEKDKDGDLEEANLKSVSRTDLH